MRFTSFLILFLFSAAKTFPQKINVDFLIKRYPHQPFVYLNKDETVKISVEKEKLVVVKHNYQKLLVLKNNLNTFRNKKIRTNDFIHARNISASLYVYNGSKHSKKTIKDIELKKEHYDDDVFFRDSKYYNIAFPGAKEGDIVEIEYDEEYAEPRFFDVFYATDYYPVLSSVFSITYPDQQVKFNTREYNYQSISFNGKSTEDNKKSKTVLWKFDSVPALVDQDYEPGFRHKASYILVSIENYKTKDSVVQVCGNLDNLFNWYMSLLKNLDVADHAEIKRFTDSLVKDTPDEKEKVKKIFYWVQNKIAYLAYEDGLGGYVPREAMMVYNRRFGDCKDMANLIVKMAESQGLPVYPAWIGTRDIPYQFSEFPAPFCANHMIAAYLKGGDTLFLDATGKYYPFGMPTSMIQGKEAFVSLGKTKYLLAKVPVLSKNVNMDTDSITLSISDKNKLEGHGYYRLSGYEQIKLLNLLEKKSYEQQKTYMRSVLEKGNNKFNLDTFYVIENNIEKELMLYYKFSINDYLTENDNLKFINLNFLKNYFDRLSTADRVYPIDFQYNCVSRLKVNLNLDARFRVDHLPPDVSTGNAVSGFEQKYRKSSQSINFENIIYINKTSVGPDNFKDWTEVMNGYKKTKSNSVSLSSI